MILHTKKINNIIDTKINGNNMKPLKATSWQNSNN